MRESLSILDGFKRCERWKSVSEREEGENDDDASDRRRRKLDRQVDS